ncbi:MAG: hypothetical protein ABIF82_00500 [Planctomycetota bacterium]
MNRFPRTVTLTVMGLLVLLAALGCRATEPVPPLHTEANPGPWADVKISMPMTVTDRGTKVTITVTEHPKGTGYVRKFELFDDSGTSIGYRVFAADKEPAETFLLDAETKQLTVEITSTSLGKWRSNPRDVPRKK